jgi:hypothetical protein
LYTTARGITNEDAVLRFYHRYLGLEAFVGIGVLLVASGIFVDGLLAFTEVKGVSALGLAGIAQAFIVVGGNIVLVGALSSMLEGER